MATLAAGAVWGLYNGALAMVFGFGPSILSERGMSLSEASGFTSIVLWIAALSIPLGGILADRIGRPQPVIFGGLVIFAIALAMAAGGITPLLAFTLIGLAAGIPAGPIMSLPGKVLPAGSAAVGMGLFFLVYYAIMLFAPSLVGWLAELAGSAELAFSAGIVMLAMTAGCQVFYNRAARHVRSQTRE